MVCTVTCSTWFNTFSASIFMSQVFRFCKHNLCSVSMMMVSPVSNLDTVCGRACFICNPMVVCPVRVTSAYFWCHMTQDQCNSMRTLLMSILPICKHHDRLHQVSWVTAAVMKQHLPGGWQFCPNSSAKMALSPAECCLACLQGLFWRAQPVSHVGGSSAEYLAGCLLAEHPPSKQNRGVLATC